MTQEIKKDLKNKFALTKKQAYFLATSGIVLFLLAGYFYSKNKNLQKPKPSSSLELSEQYRKQLPDLKNRAESNSANDLQNYGIALYATGNLQEAEQTYKKQIEVDPENSVAHNNLANTLRDEKKFEQAAEEYEQAIKFSPKALNSYTNLASLYQYSLGDLDKAIAVYGRAIEAMPDNADFNVLLGIAFEQKKDFANARKSFEKALMLQENNQPAKAGIERIKSEK